MEESIKILYKVEAKFPIICYRNACKIVRKGLPRQDLSVYVSLNLEIDFWVHVILDFYFILCYFCITPASLGFFKILLARYRHTINNYNHTDVNTHNALQCDRYYVDTCVK